MNSSSQPETRNQKLETVVIRSIDQVSPDTVTLSLQTYFPYKPGQSIQIQLPNDPKKRYYSLSSSPTEAGHIAVTIKIDPNHALEKIIPQLKKGDAVAVEGPFGKFGLPEKLEGKLIFIAGGSGITPFRSMIKYLRDSRNSLETWLFHSAKTPSDLLFNAEFTAWTKDTPGFRYIPTVTRTPGTDWELDTGRIGEALLQKHLTALDGHFFLCGPKAFVADMELLLTDTLEVPADRVRREQW